MYARQRWHGCVATIEECDGGDVYGVLWELDNQHLPTLDDQEGVKENIYRRFQVKVRKMKNKDQKTDRKVQ